jgi:hypothetical protein
VATARTDVATERAGRYLVQLCEHLRQIGSQTSHHTAHGAPAEAAEPHRPPRLRRVEWTDSHGVIEFAAGRCRLDATDDALALTLDADDADELHRMQELFKTRLETIGRRDNLAVRW